MTEIRIDPEQMRAVSRELDDCREISEFAARNTVAAILKFHDAVEVSAIDNLRNKMDALGKKLIELTDRIESAAVFLELVADNFENGDKQLMNQPERLAESIDERVAWRHAQTTKIGEWGAEATDSEYALLASIWSSVSTKENSIDEFIKELAKRLPANSPLNKLSRNYIREVKSDTGLEALILTDPFGNATVVFAGTNNPGDFFDDDIQILAGRFPDQREEAIRLIDDLSVRYNNITVTGHSLGGYLATSVTLHNSNISRCVSFDPLGQPILKRGTGNLEINEEFFSPNSDKITTYNTEGIVKSVGGSQVGDRKTLDIPWQPTDNYGNLALDRMAGHNIDDIYEALGGYDSIKNNWSGGQGGR